MESPSKSLGGRAGAADPGIIGAGESEVESVYDTVAPIAPCFRRGAVIQALSISEGAESRPIRRDAFQARELGLALVNRAPAIDQRVANAIQATGKKLNLSVQSLELVPDIVRSRFAPGLILDFPAHAFRLGPFLVRERTCVTVCYNEAASKIWIRFIVTEVDEGEHGASNLADFFRFCGEASRAGINATGAVYLEEFRAKYKGQNEVEFNELGDIAFVGLDSNALKFNDYVNTDSVGVVAGAEQIPDDKRRLFTGFFREHIRSFFPRRFSRDRIADISKDKISVFKSEFDYRALYHGIFEKNAVTFLVMSEPGQPVRAYNNKRESGALTVISELAATAIKDF